MPVFSYLAYPVTGGKQMLFKALSALEQCEVIPADQQEVLLLVTDTPDEETERLLQDRLKALPALQSLSMTFGHRDG
ncbi:MAG: hypothetical protein M0036_04330 [Desulfobacteraceae bacterium]|nr:hypothetical protein [Desulfobacteraceae bacterium]